MDALNPIADLPMGFGMALAQDLSAMDRFASLSPDERAGCSRPPFYCSSAASSSRRRSRSPRMSSP